MRRGLSVVFTFCKTYPLSDVGKVIPSTVILGFIGIPGILCMHAKVNFIILCYLWTLRCVTYIHITNSD